jgi:type III secretion system HrpB2-like protein
MDPVLTLVEPTTAAMTAAQAQLPATVDSMQPSQLDRLAAKFQSLMNAETSSGATEPHQVGSVEGSPIGRMVEAQDALFNQAIADADRLGELSGQMTMSQMTAASIQVATELSMVNVDMEVKMAFVQSSQQALKTLVHNQ